MVLLNWSCWTRTKMIKTMLTQYKYTSKIVCHCIIYILAIVLQKLWSLICNINVAVILFNNWSLCQNKCIYQEDKFQEDQNVSLATYTVQSYTLLWRRGATCRNHCSNPKLDLGQKREIVYLKPSLGTAWMKSKFVLTQTITPSCLLLHAGPRNGPLSWPNQACKAISCTW